MSNQHTAPYSDAEIELIEEKYRELGPYGLAAIMPNRTLNGIVYKARFLDVGLKMPERKRIKK